MRPPCMHVPPCASLHAWTRLLHEVIGPIGYSRAVTWHQLSRCGEDPPHAPHVPPMHPMHAWAHLHDSVGPVGDRVVAPAVTLWGGQGGEVNGQAGIRQVPNGLGRPSLGEDKPFPPYGDLSPPTQFIYPLPEASVRPRHERLGPGSEEKCGGRGEVWVSDYTIRRKVCGRLPLLLPTLNFSPPAQSPLPTSSIKMSGTVRCRMRVNPVILSPPGSF